MKIVEIELRFEILNPQEIASFVAKFIRLGTKRVIDTYFDTPTIDLIKKGVYIRLRDEKRIDIKFNRECLNNPELELQPYCEEYTFFLPLQEHDIHSFNSISKTIGLQPITKSSFDQFKLINELNPHRVVDKVRTSFAHGPFTIMIDEVADLGTFLEIEYMSHALALVEEIKAQMLETLLPLSLKPLKTGYDALILRKNNFNHYLQGRFVLDEDKALKKELLENAQN